MLLLTACETADEELAPSAPESRDAWVAVYFLDEHGLMPVYARLPEEGDPAAALVGLIARGDPSGRFASLLPGDAEVLEEREAEPEGLALEMNEGFWELPDGERFAAAAQIVHTVATLEAGKNVVLMQGFVPGEIRDGNGERVPQPLTRDRFAELAPWIEILQPAAGAVVGRTFPVEAELRGARRARAALLVDGRRVASEVLDGGRASFEVTDGGRSDAVVRVRGAWPDGRVRTVDVPVRLRI